MKKLLLICVLAFTLVGCETMPAQKEIVFVDKPIPFVPKPPEVPKFTSEVDKLTMDDASDPGKVGQAYKYDMTQLRQMVKIYQMILEQYAASSQDFEAINKEIDTLVNQINGSASK